MLSEWGVIYIFHLSSRIISSESPAQLLNHSDESDMSLAHWKMGSCTI